MIRFVAKKRRHTVSASIRSFTYSRLAGAVTAIWLCGAGAAWAGGGGGEDLGTLNTYLQSTLCPFAPSIPCPQLPTVTQAVLQTAAWLVAPTETIRATNAIANGSRVDAGNPSFPPVGPTPPAITAFPVTAPVLSNLLPNLTPLAFVSSSKSPAAATQLYNDAANTFFYAVASGSGTQPDTLYLFYDDPRHIINIFLPGQVIAKISLPLVVLTGYGTPTPTETLAPTTLQIVVPSKPPAPGSGVAVNCSASSVSGTGIPQTVLSPTGVNCAVVVAPSPLSPIPHAIFEVRVPLVLTDATDPLYFAPIANIGSPFKSDETGFPLSNGTSIGIGPTAVPLCSTTGTCPPSSPSPMFALCANLPGLLGPPAPAVAAYYAISTAGETLLSAALPGFSSSVCPF
jgi:hypothetical protein